MRSAVARQRLRNVPPIFECVMREILDQISTELTLLVALAMGFQVRRYFRSKRVLLSSGRKLRPSPPADVTFSERGVSGFSERTLVTRAGGAWRVLMVWVTPRELVIESVSPFDVLMYGNPSDIEHVIPQAKIAALEPLGVDRVRVRFERPEGRSGSFQLVLKRRDDFVPALGK